MKLEELEKLKKSMESMEVVRKDEIDDIAEVLGLKAQELRALSEKDPFRFLELVFVAKESKIEELEKMNKDLQINPLTKNDIWKDLNMFVKYCNSLTLKSGEIENALQAYGQIQKLIIVLASEASVEATAGSAYMTVLSRLNMESINLESKRRESEESIKKVEAKEELSSQKLALAQELEDRMLQRFNEFETIYFALRKYKEEKEIGEKADEILKQRESIKKPEEPKVKKPKEDIIVTDEEVKEGKKEEEKEEEEEEEEDEEDDRILRT